MADSIEELRGRVNALAEEIRTLSDKDDITADEDVRLDAALAEHTEARAAYEKAEAREAAVAVVRAAAQIPAAVKPAIENVNVNVRTSPFDLDELRSVTPEKRATEVRARARDIVEHSRGGYSISDASAEHLERQLKGRSKVARDIAEMIVQTGSDEYRESFENVLSDPSNIAYMSDLQARQKELQSRAAIQHAGVAGALHVPYALDPTLILTNAGVVDPVRSVSRGVSITGTDTWVAPTSAGITAGLVSESASFTDNTPTYVSTSISVYKFGAFAFGSYEALADSGAADDLGLMFADAKERAEASYLATGTGSSQPQGVVVFASNSTSVVAGTSGAANSADLVAADIYKLQQELSPRFRGGAVWMGSLATANAIRQLGTTNNYHAFSLDITQAGPPNLLGRAFYENSSMDTTIVSGSTDFAILYGDFSQFVVVDRVGLVMKYQDIVTSGSKFPTGESAWHVYWRMGSAGLVQDAFRLLKL
jgi:HK97 family phage major capsid protein